MLIAHLARTCYPFHPYGGLEKHVYHLTLELARFGHDVALFTQPPHPNCIDNRVNDVAWQTNVQHYYLKYTTVKLLRGGSIPDRLINYPIFAWNLGGQARQLQPKPTIVHAHGLAGFGYSQQKLVGVPLVLNPHGMEEFKNRSRAKQIAYTPFRTILRQTARAASRVIATDKLLIPEVQHYLKIPSNNITLIPNAIALDELDALADVSQLAQQHNLQSVVLLSVGRLEANKGFDIMLKALSLAKSQLDQLYPAWQWLVVGEGSEATKLKALANQYNLTNNIKWLGSISLQTLHSVYQSADLFVHPTLYEGSSLVTLEALAHRLPVLASATGGIPDKVFERGNYENGRLFPVGDSITLAKLLLEMLAWPAAKRKELGHNGRALVEAQFSWRTAALQTVELYQNLLNAETC